MRRRRSPELYTPLELYEKYREELDKVGWTASVIGSLFRAHLLKGYYCTQEMRNLIIESSFLELLEIAKKIKAQKMELAFGSRQLTNLMTPMELCMQHDYVNSLDWTPSVVGIMFKANLLLGKFSSHEKKSLIYEENFLEMIPYADAIKAYNIHNFNR